MSTIEIRKAQTADLPQVQEIARRTIDRSYRSFLGDDAVDGFINSGAADAVFEQQFDSCDVLLQDGVIVAFAIYFDDLIDLMMVDERHHRRGIGSQLLSHSENRLFANGQQRIRLETFSGNHQAINFYLKNGWTLTGQQEDMANGFTRLFFEKQALQSPCLNSGHI